MSRRPKLQLYHLRHVPWLHSQLLYHAMPQLGIEGVIILAPAQPYACIGYHQDLEQEVDLAFCREQGIPVFRREVGGGAVYLDGNQLFYQIVLHRDNPLARGSKASVYERFLPAVAQAYRDLGVPSSYRPVNDIVTADGRKISGNGAGEIADHVVLVGNLIADFDYETMVRVLRVPDAKFRDKAYKSMRENLTTLRRETGRQPAWDEMVGALVARLEKVCGELHPTELPRSVYERAEELLPTFQSDAWLHRKGRLVPGRAVKVAEGVKVVQRLHKAPGGLLRATMEVKGERLSSVSLSGDFFAYPSDAIVHLEHSLEGASVEQVPAIIAALYAEGSTEIPGVTELDWLKVLLE